MKNRLYLLALLSAAMILCAGLLVGCSSQNGQDTRSSQQAEEPSTKSKASKKPNPEAAMKEIYTGMSDRIGLTEPSRTEVRDVVGLNLDDVESYYIRYVEGDFGVSDVYIIKPLDGEDEEGKSHKDNVTNSLKERKDQRIREFANYDVYNSTQISENAVIFERGGYVVMLMMEDNEAARASIEKHIPEKLEIA